MIVGLPGIELHSMVFEYVVRRQTQPWLPIDLLRTAGKRYRWVPRVIAVLLMDGLLRVPATVGSTNLVPRQGRMLATLFAPTQESLIHSASSRNCIVEDFNYPTIQ